MNLIIKKASEQDIFSIHQIVQEAFEKYARDLGLPEKVSALKETPHTIKEELHKKTIFIAYLNQFPVGTIRFEVLPPGKIGYISRFGVRPDVQNCGVGKALINAVEEEAKQMGVSALTLHTASKMTRLIRFYYGMGFYIHSTTTDRGYIRALLCKELSQYEAGDLEVVNAL
ncbi:MAG: GNAT family N-acetyltransferase [Clostridiales bacterium]|nr:GNAT family N-acetyltransferase [Clostridiales bacterium]